MGASNATLCSEASRLVETANEPELSGYSKQELTTSMDTKQSQWAARSELRTKELAAISEAISLLHSDSARDLSRSR